MTENDNDDLTLDDDPEWDNYREQRIAEMKRLSKEQEMMKTNSHGLYTEVTEEKEFLKISTTTKKLICHFYKSEFLRCKILDQHLDVLARKHFKTKFVKVDVETVPFFVEKLHIQVLPALFCFVDGRVVDKLIGFEELGGKDSFPTERLERRLLAGSDILELKKSSKGGIFGRGKGSDEENESDEDRDN